MTRVGILLHNEENAALLADWIETVPSLTPVVADPDDLETVEADAVLLDVPTLVEARRRIQALKRETQLFVPLLLLATRERTRRLDFDVWDVADDVIWREQGQLSSADTQTFKRELRGRLRALRRARTLSADLDRERARHERLVEGLPVVILIVQDGEIQYANGAAEGLLKRPVTELVGLRFDAFVHTDDRERVRRLIDRSEEDRLIDFSDTRLVRDDGRIVNAEVAADPAIHRGEVATQITIRDLTATRRREQQLKVLDRVLRHNLRNKLTAIMGHTESIRYRSDEPEVQDLAQSVIDASEELGEIAETARMFEHVIGDDFLPGETDLVELIVKSVAGAGDAYPAATFHVDTPDRAYVALHEGFELALEELLETTLDVCTGSDPVIDITVIDAESSHWVELQVATNSRDIPERIRRTLNEETESQLSHTQRLDLWLLKWATESVGGNFELMGREPRGVVVAMWLPRPPARRTAE
jgi:PAS domain S-box-containing protein